MATEWYLMGKMPVYNSGFEQEEFDAYATDSFSEILATSPISKTVQIVNHDLSLILELRVIVLNNVADSINKSVERQFLATIGTLQCGDYIKFENKIWIISSLVGNNGIYEKAIATLCNYTLKFQSPDGTILSYSCIDSTNSSMGLDVNNTITVPNSIHTMKLPFDANILTLREDRRLFISRDTIKPRSFKITKVNDTEFAYGDKGIIEFTLEQTVGDYPKDRIDLGICDYFEPTITPTPSPTGDTMTILSSGTLLAGGLKRTFTPKLVDSNGVEQTFTAVWTFNYNGMPTGDFIITYDGNKCMISVAEDYDIVDNSLVLTCTSSDGLYSTSYNAVISA